MLSASNSISISLAQNQTMEIWSLILISIFFSALIHLFLFNMKKRKLPPGPPAIPFLGNFLWLRRPFGELDPQVLHDLFKKHGPIVTLFIGPRPFIFVASGAVAHKALVEQGAVFSDRPTPPPATAFISSNQHDVTSGAYGPLWVFMRRNITSEILHPSTVKRFAGGREWALSVLVKRLHDLSRASDAGVVVAKDSFQFAMFCLAVPMCFGKKLDEKLVGEIGAAQRNALLHGPKLNVFSIFPTLSKLIFFKRLKVGIEMRKKQKELFLPLIEAQREHNRRQDQRPPVCSYVDSILDIKIPEEGGCRRLTDDEIVTLCSDFLDAGTETTWTALQWIMAELVRNPEIQRRLIEEIEGVAGGDGAVKEEEIQRMPYVKAVVMEGMRRHPPSYIVIPHAVTRETELEGYVIPREAPINFMVAEIGWDERAWGDPMEFRPERFLDGDGQGVDITGSREVRMMPFGVGRRICPGLGLAMLHLEYFVANLVREFEWKAAEGEEIDMSEELEFTTVMKYPLRARLIPRTNP